MPRRATIPNRKIGDLLDVAIIGGGPAGLYAAWRLQRNGQDSDRIAIFEASDRLGGRILSATIPGIPYIIELGAMRYIPEQILTRHLIEDVFRLPNREFTFNTAGFFLRGKFIPKDAFVSARANKDDVSIPYNVDHTERGRDPIELIELAILRALRDLELPDANSSIAARGMSVSRLRNKLRALNEDTPPENLVKHFDPKEWRMIRQHGYVSGRALYKTGFWDLVQERLSLEGYFLAHDGCGYQSILSMWNAADALLWFLADFTSSPYRTIVGGMTALVNRFEAELGSKEILDGGITTINREWTLVRVERIDNHVHSHLALHFRIGDVSLDEPIMRIVKAKSVILALPQPAIKLVSFDNLSVTSGDSPKVNSLLFNTLLNSVTANPLFKAFAVYKRPWWQGVDPSQGFRVFTDLPTRMIYCYGTSLQAKLHDVQHNADDCCMILLYSDSRFAEFWKHMHIDSVASKEQIIRSDWLTSISSAKDLPSLNEVLEAYGTTDVVGERIRRQIGIIVNHEAPVADAIVLKHWSDAPYHVGWHSWNVGVRSWDVSAEISKPFADADVFICGEAFSTEQGWIEGALKSTERVLEKMKVPLPSWLNEHDYHTEVIKWS